MGAKTAKTKAAKPESRPHRSPKAHAAKSGSASTEKKKRTKKPASAKRSTRVRAKRAPEKREYDEATRRFERELLVRGEAAVPDEHGALPSGATHAIVGEKEDGTPHLERRRFSMT
jgi:hypothetical protein